MYVYFDLHIVTMRSVIKVLELGTYFVIHDVPKERSNSIHIYVK